MKRLPIIWIVVLVGTLAASGSLVHILTEVWWFDAVGFVEVFWTKLTWQILIWLATFVLYGLFLWGNYRLAMRLTRSHPFHFLEDNGWETPVPSTSNYVALIIITLVALISAGASISAWETVLKFLNSSNFGSADPIYQNDIGFYIFKLPLYEGIQAWLLTLTILALVLSTVLYGLKGVITPQGNWKNILTGKVKGHLSLLLAASAILVAVGFWLQRYELLYSPEGVVFGAGYTDVRARLSAYWTMTFVTLALAGLFLLAIWRRGFALPIYGIGLYLVILVLVSGIYPWFQQLFIVEPNELDKERPYVAYNIDFTREAYGLEQVQRERYPAKGQLNHEILQANQATVGNIRLWDYRPLLSTYHQLQEIRLYYRFRDVDVDRYTLDGDYRQVMLAARELAYSQVPSEAQTWVNQRLKYTHGYGLVMSSVNRVTPQGLPDLLIKDIPPVSNTDRQVSEPAIYYGEATNHYIFTGTNTEEFDYPRGSENAFTLYEGTGGVPIPSIWHRLAYAYDLGSLKILISNYFTQDSRIHYYRQIRQRVQHVAPFLRFDHNPYITVINGQLKWIIDAYTVSDRYPYSEPVARSNNANVILQGNIRQILGWNGNYIRNSVKVVVDAFNGDMRFFVVDPQDPLLATYRKIFPNLFEPVQAVPPEIRAHFRYPIDFFKIQAQMYLAYHMSNPDVFYNREDLWRFPTEVYEENEQLMEPYYVIMRLPAEAREEFILILPFTPANKDNMIAWMAARSDGEHYGKLLLYEFPKQELVYGPHQVEARIDQNPEISERLTLWSQKGSRVIRGDLLVIPIQESLLYVEPVYLRAEQGELPELKRIIVAYGDQIVMAASLEDALADIFGDSPPLTQQVSADTRDLKALIKAAQAAYQQSQDALDRRDWNSYGQSLQNLGNLLQQLSQQVETLP
ncbi:upf0182 protein [Leptolyngbya sp. Heron Island J]|uniref:UPF0182 family membrane protein n=1 Tax=Leptolyngbya sp. Heron Island J TaxID=1385935 RepID=UPI0003B99D4E|nr:UPF0182 family protein [Leptolyngbya sp. Heron Island J]ESA37455.1 upf0182 protein [Leptolyngbya sp. Heron Island J]